MPFYSTSAPCFEFICYHDLFTYSRDSRHFTLVTLSTEPKTLPINTNIETMAETSTTDHPHQPQDSWEAPQIEAALAHLERLQNQVRDQFILSRSNH